jgi:hypothetical protein
MLWSTTAPGSFSRSLELVCWHQLMASCKAPGPSGSSKPFGRVLQYAAGELGGCLPRQRFSAIYVCDIEYFCDTNMCCWRAGCWQSLRGYSRCSFWSRYCAMNRTAVLYALLSAALFGASTPAAKFLVGSVYPAMLAGLLYCGAGIGIATLRRVLPERGEQRRGRK